MLLIFQKSIFCVFLLFRKNYQSKYILRKILHEKCLFTFSRSKCIGTRRLQKHKGDTLRVRARKASIHSVVLCVTLTFHLWLLSICKNLSFLQHHLSTGIDLNMKPNSISYYKYKSILIILDKTKITHCSV